MRRTRHGAKWVRHSMKKVRVRVTGRGNRQAIQILAQTTKDAQRACNGRENRQAIQIQARPWRWTTKDQPFASKSTSMDASESESLDDSLSHCKLSAHPWWSELE